MQRGIARPQRRASDRRRSCSGNSLIAAALFIAGASAAFAHVTLETQEAKIGSTYKAVLRVPHGCDGKATKAIRVQIPEGVIAVKPMPKAGWKLETVKGKYEKSYELYGAQIGEGVKEVVWSGGDLADEFYDEFVFRGVLTDSLAAGEALYFPTRAGMRRRDRALDRDPCQGPGRGRAGVSGAGREAAAEGTRVSGSRAPLSCRTSPPQGGDCRRASPCDASPAQPISPLGEMSGRTGAASSFRSLASLFAFPSLRRSRLRSLGADRLRAGRWRDGSRSRPGNSRSASTSRSRHWS